MKQRDKKALKKLNHYLKQRGDLAVTQNAVHAAILQRINRLSRLANKLEMDDSGMMGLGLHKVYAFEIADTARELRTLFYEL